MNSTISTLMAFIGVLIVLSTLTQSVQEALKNLLNLKAGVWERFVRDLYERDLGLQQATPKVSVLARLLRRTTGLRGVVATDFVGDFRDHLVRLNRVGKKSTELLSDMDRLLQEIGTTSAAESERLGVLEGKLATCMKALTDLGLERAFKLYGHFDTQSLAELGRALASAKKNCEAVRRAPTEAALDWKNECELLQKAVDEAHRNLSRVRVLLESRLDGMLARVNDNYSRHMLGWTVVVGACLVVASNADAFRLYQRLGSSPELQTAAIEAAQSTARKKLTSKAADLDALHQLVSDQAAKPKAKTKALAAFARHMADDYTALGDGEGATKASNLSSELKNLTHASAKPEVPLKAYEEKLGVLYIELNLSAVRNQLPQAQLPLGWTEEDASAFHHPRWSSGFWLALLHKLGGLGLTTFLITFGAPFWNDILTILIGIKKSKTRTETQPTSPEE